MNERTCLIDGCERPSHVPGTARGWCGSHYHAWQRWGDPLDSAPRRNLAACNVAGCEAPSLHRDRCQKHYTRWLNYGDVYHRSPGEVIDGKRICPGCRIDLPLDQYGANRARLDGLSNLCLRCNAKRAAERRATKPPNVMPDSAKTPTECAGCGVTFLAEKRRRKYCSPACSKAYKNRDNWPHMNARRARLREAFVEFFDRFEIFERDGWVCGICDLPVDPALKFPDPGSASLDHIIPIIRGGKHERANAQTSHLHCNVVKIDRVA